MSNNNNNNNILLKGLSLTPTPLTSAPLSPQVLGAYSRTDPWARSRSKTLPGPHPVTLRGQRSNTYMSPLVCSN